MKWQQDLHMIGLRSKIKESSPHAEPILVISLTAILGLIPGSIKIRGMKLGVAGMLVSGLLLGYSGLSRVRHLMVFLRESGVVLFVFTIRLQLGPGFYNSVKQDGPVPTWCISDSIVGHRNSLVMGLGKWFEALADDLFRDDD